MLIHVIYIAYTLLENVKLHTNIFAKRKKGARITY